MSAPTVHGKVGLRTSITGEVVMDDVFAGLYAAIVIYAAVLFIPGFGVFPYEQ